MQRERAYTSQSERRARASSFATVAGEYERGRPGYPPEAIDWLLGASALRVLDLGAGTGKLTAAVLARGHAVIAVEPLAEMRAILQERLPAARVIAGSAEELPLAERSVDAVVVGAAFHWFDQERALAEIARVLRGGGILGLLGNAFDVSLPWVAALRSILGPPALERPGHWPEADALRERFGEVEDSAFAHEQEVDLAMLRDLASSRSSVATLAPAQRSELLARIDRLWEERDELRGRERVGLPWIARVRRCRGLRGGSVPWRVLVVDAEAVRPLRGEVLRPGRALAERSFAGDDAPDTLHLAARVGERIVAIASVMCEDCPRVASARAWRIRGMATAPEMRGRGIGAVLLARCEQHARDLGGTLLWCNARVRARRLYERAGLHVVGEPFDIPPIGKHYVMCKEL